MIPILIGGKPAGSSQMEVKHESIRKFRTEKRILLF